MPIPDPVERAFEFGFPEGLLTFLLVCFIAGLGWIGRVAGRAYEDNEKRRTEALESQAAAMRSQADSTEAIRDCLKEQVVATEKIASIEKNTLAVVENDKNIKRVARHAIVAAKACVDPDNSEAQARLDDAIREIQ